MNKDCNYWGSGRMQGYHAVRCHVGLSVLVWDLSLILLTPEWHLADPSPKGTTADFRWLLLLWGMKQALRSTQCLGYQGGDPEPPKPGVTQFFMGSSSFLSSSFTLGWVETAFSQWRQIIDLYLFFFLVLSLLFYLRLLTSIYFFFWFWLTLLQGTTPQSA